MDIYFCTASLLFKETKMNKLTIARFALWLPITFAVILAVLHILEPEFNLGGHLISEYELGRFGWLMTLAFWSLGAASLFLAYSIRDDLRGRSGAIGFWWLLLIAIAYFGAGLFYPDESTGGLGLPFDPVDFKRGTVAPTLNASMHGLSGIIVIFSSPIAFTLLCRSLPNNPQWSPRLGKINWATTAAWIGLLLSPFSLVLYYFAQQPSGFDFRIIASIVNRIMILAYAAWLAITAWQKMKLGANS
jgi:Protein of unknown function (DUF998)